MAARTTATKSNETIDVLEITRGRMNLYLLGDAPLICNAMSQKVQHELLAPSSRRSAAERASKPKHTPIEEYRSSVYYARDPASPTLVVMKATSFKRSAMGAALDLPGVAKAQVGRLLYVVGDEVPIYGQPEIMMSVVRCADKNRTPDVRTRAIIPSWCAVVTVEFAEPLLKSAIVARLFAGAGITQGVGDWRVEKGSGSYGRFSIVEPEHPTVKALIETGGRETQRNALDNPIPYDSETEELLSWYDVETKRRGFKVVS